MASYLLTAVKTATKLFGDTPAVIVSKYARLVRLPIMRLSSAFLFLIFPLFLYYILLSLFFLSRSHPPPISQTHTLLDRAMNEASSRLLPVWNAHIPAGAPPVTLPVAAMVAPNARVAAPLQDVVYFPGCGNRYAIAAAVLAVLFLFSQWSAILSSVSFP